MFENLIEVLKNDPRKIVYTEGSDARILESAARLKKDGFLTPILVGNVDEVKAAAAKGGFDIEGLESEGVTIDVIKDLLSVDKKLWLEDIENLKEFYEKIGDRLPEEMKKQLSAFEDRLK